MLKELSKFVNLGTPAFYLELFSKVQYNNGWTVCNLNNYFYNRVVDGRSTFDGCIPLLKTIEIIQINSRDEVSIDHSFNSTPLSIILITDRFLEKLFLKLKDDDIFYEIFSSKYISFDIIYNTVQIDNSAFPFKYSVFKQLLIDFDILKVHPVKELNKFILNKRYKRLFDRTVLPEIKKRKIGVSQLQASLEQKQLYGEEAEKFVLKFEHDRLEGKKEVLWVAEYSVAEGYDIASYNSNSSTSNDRFIEVKSFDNEVSFYWSRNEIDIARVKKDNYFLYLVDRGKMNSKNYVPLIIQNPYVEVLKNEAHWDQSVEKIRFRKR